MNADFSILFFFFLHRLCLPWIMMLMLRFLSSS